MGAAKIYDFVFSVTNNYKCKIVQWLFHVPGLWGLVNNAGIMQRKLGPVEWLIKKDYQECCEVNLFGLVDVTKTFLPLIKKKKGRIVNTSSIVGIMGFPGSAPYVVSKYGVEGFSECLRYTVSFVTVLV